MTPSLFPLPALWIPLIHHHAVHPPVPSALLCVLLNSAPDPGGMWGRTGMWDGAVPALPPRFVLTDSRAWITLGVHARSSAKPPRFITTELGGFHAARSYLWVLLSSSVTLHSAGRRLSVRHPGYFGIKEQLGYPGTVRIMEQNHASEGLLVEITQHIFSQGPTFMEPPP